MATPFEPLTQAQVVQALYNNTCAVGMGIFHDLGRNMTEAEAEKIVAHARSVEEKFGGNGRWPKGTIHFDYLYGRPLKVTVTPTHVESEHLYTRDSSISVAAVIEDALERLTQP